MDPGTITRVVNAEHQEKPDPSTQRWVYEQLRSIAASHLGREWGVLARDLDLTLVVHECWLRLASTGKWDSRAHYFGAASRAVRHILIDEARKRRRHRAGVAPVSRGGVAAPPSDNRVLEIDAALERLGERNARAAEVASLKLFGDLPAPIIAQLLGVTSRTVERDWRFARAWIAAQLEPR